MTAPVCKEQSEWATGKVKLTKNYGELPLACVCMLDIDKPPLSVCSLS